MIVAILWVVICVANEITITDVYQIRTYAEEIYTGFALGDTLVEAQARFLPGAFLLSLLTFVVFVLAKMFSRLDRSHESHGSYEFDWGRWRLPVSICMAALLLFLIGVPLINLCWKVDLSLPKQIIVICARGLPRAILR